MKIVAATTTAAAMPVQSFVFELQLNWVWNFVQVEFGKEMDVNCGADEN